jgi:hypothetical protein
MIPHYFQLLARCQNVQKGGPRTAEGKTRSRLSALKHGATARTPVLPDEDPEAFLARVEERLAVLQPRNTIERDFADNYILSTWQRKRCIRAEAAMAARRMEQAEVEEPLAAKDQALALGAILYWDQYGDYRLYPHLDEGAGVPISRPSSPDDPNDPARVLLRLESFLEGCQWLLDERGKLRDRLQPGLSWDSHHKFRAVRLLGRQPIDLPDEPEIPRIYVAAHTIYPQFGSPFEEILCEFNRDEMRNNEVKSFIKTVRRLPWRALAPKTATEARAQLTKLVDTAIARLQQIVAAHQDRAAYYVQHADGAFAFDASTEGERLRRQLRTSLRESHRWFYNLERARKSEVLDVCEAGATAPAVGNGVTACAAPAEGVQAYPEPAPVEPDEPGELVCQGWEESNNSGGLGPEPAIQRDDTPPSDPGANDGCAPAAFCPPVEEGAGALDPPPLMHARWEFAPWSAYADAAQFADLKRREREIKSGIDRTGRKPGSSAARQNEPKSLCNGPEGPTDQPQRGAGHTYPAPPQETHNQQEPEPHRETRRGYA